MFKNCSCLSLGGFGTTDSNMLGSSHWSNMLGSSRWSNKGRRNVGTANHALHVGMVKLLNGGVHGLFKPQDMLNYEGRPQNVLHWKHGRQVKEGIGWGHHQTLHLHPLYHLGDQICTRHGWSHGPLLLLVRKQSPQLCNLISHITNFNNHFSKTRIVLLLPKPRFVRLLDCCSLVFVCNKQLGNN